MLGLQVGIANPNMLPLRKSDDIRAFHIQSISTAKLTNWLSLGIKKTTKVGIPCLFIPWSSSGSTLLQCPKSVPNTNSYRAKIQIQIFSWEEMGYPRAIVGSQVRLGILRSESDQISGKTWDIFRARLLWLQKSRVWVYRHHGIHIGSKSAHLQ